ncbi:MAG: FKBP-type peptidyl-prolyl cis-trans isomerase [Gammaproteobacteria bacterium]|nr:FKBP-type peptidyl-prolyl cis-trans isomerase [Gammaproteobacteria bacterium]
MQSVRPLAGVRNFTVMAMLALAGCSQEAREPTVELADDEAKGTYGIAFEVTKNLIDRYGGLLESGPFRAGVADALAKRPSRVSDNDKLAGFNALNDQLNGRKQLQEVDNRASGRSFLAENGKRDGVVTLESGLQYEVLIEGDGETPGPTDRVTTHYHGTLLDGTVFDSSVERGKPIGFAVNGVIAGWTEALQLMQVGDKWRLFIPPELAYKARGAGAKIGPNATLIFEVELLEVDR